MGQILLAQGSVKAMSTASRVSRRMINPTTERAARRGADDCLVTGGSEARDQLVSDHSRITASGGHLQAGGVSPLSLLTFFAAAKKVSAAPHRGSANRPP